MTTEKCSMTGEVEYWGHQKSGESYAVLPKKQQCFGPLYYEEIFKITEGDERFDNEDWEWLNGEPCGLVEP